MAKFAQYYLKYNLEHMFSFEHREERQKHFGVFFETNESIAFFLQYQECRQYHPKCINDVMQVKHYIGIELFPQYYPKDFYKAWRMHQHHTTRLRFNLSESELPIGFDEKEWDDDSIMGFAIKANEETLRKKYRTVLELNPPENTPFLPIDEDSVYIKNLVNFSSQTGNRIEIVTSDGAIFNCYINDNEESDSIVCSELDAELLDALFDEVLITLRKEEW